MCCFHYFSLAPPRRRFIIVFHSSMFSTQFFSTKRMCRMTRKHQHCWLTMADETFALIWQMKEKNIKLRNFEVKILFSSKKIIKFHVKLKIFKGKRSKIVERTWITRYTYFDLLLLLCQFWHLFSKAEKNERKSVKTKREKMLISCFDGYERKHFEFCDVKCVGGEQNIFPNTTKNQLLCVCLLRYQKIFFFFHWTS